MTEDQVIERVRFEVKRSGSMRAYARTIGVTVSYVSDLLNGRRAPGPKILDPLGLEKVKVIEYRPKGWKKARG